MTSVKNLSSLGSMAIYTLREGSITERIVLGAVLTAMGAYVAYKIVQVVSSFFKAPQSGVALSINRGLNPVERKALEAKYAADFRISDVETPKSSAELNKPVPQLTTHSVLESLTLQETEVTKEQEVLLDRALHDYQALKQELKADIGGDEDLFIFLAKCFLQNGANKLPSEVNWVERKLVLKMAQHYNETFAKLQSNLQSVGLSLNNLTRSENPFAVVKFKDGSSQEIHNLADLYQTIELRVPHILITLETEVTKEQEVLLARALHGYQALKQELKADIGGDEDHFIFLANCFLRNGNKLPSEVSWVEKKLVLKMALHYNETFAKLQSNLQSVGLSLNNLTRSEKPFAQAKFKDKSSKEIHNLADLYQTIELRAPHILITLEVELKKKEGEKVKIHIQESRMVIIDRMLSTLKTVLIDDFVNSFGEKNEKLYTIVGSNRETLHFVLENICWHALDRVFETVETTFIPSKEAEQKTRQLDLETQLGKVLKDEVKLKAAQSYLLQILEKPDNNEAMGALVNLLQTEEGNDSERKSLVKKVQVPDLQSQEESVEKELGRLRGVQQFYHRFNVAAAVAEAGKDALRPGNGDKNNKAKSTVKQIPSAVASSALVENNLFTYAKQIDKLSHEIVEAGSEAVEEVADLKWCESLRSLNEELNKVPHLSDELCAAIVKKGWVNFDLKRRNELLPLTGEHRWLITKKMIVQRLAKEHLQQKGKELLQEVGNRGAYFFNTMYGRFVTAFLAFDRRTRWATKEKPADCIAETFFESVLKCHQALGRVKKDRPNDGGNREKDVVTQLEENRDMHLNAVNTPGADAVFLGHLILQLLFVLQPGGLAEDIRDALNKSWINPGEAEPTLIQEMIRKYRESIRPAVEPWVKPGGDFLMHVLQYIIEKKSIVTFASQLSDLLDPVNLNALLVDFLKDDKSEIKFELESSGHKERVKWYRSDEKLLRRELDMHTELDDNVKAMEKSFETFKTMSSSKKLEEFTQKLKSSKIKLADLNKRLVPELLRRLAIAAEVPSGLIGYVMQFADDLFELMQYPRVLRHIVFNVLQKSVHSLTEHLEENDKELLQGPVNKVADQSVFDFFFSGPLKANLGNKIVTLFSSMEATENQGSMWVWAAQTVASWVRPGGYVFSLIQKQIETLVKNKFKDDKAINWSASKLVVTLNEHIQQSAKDKTGEGMKEGIAFQLKKALGFKEEEKKDSVLLEEEEYVSAEEEESRSEEEDGFVKVLL